jgi:hypothetical protein
MLHLLHVSDESENGEFQGRHRPFGQLMRAQVAELPDELVALVLEPADQQLSKISFSARLVPAREIELGQQS